MSLTKLCSENVCAEVQNRETPTKKRSSQTEKHEEIDEECSRAYEDGSKNCLNEQLCHTMSSRKRHAEKIVGSDHVDVAVKKNRQGDENNVGETCAKHSGGVTEKCKNGTNTENSYEAQLYLQVVYMFVGLGTKLLLELFLYLLKHDDIDMSLVDFLKSNETKQRLIKLSRDKVINEKEYRLATANNPKAENFDISLLLTLMRNLLPNTILSSPKYGWTKPPPQSDGSISADLLRLRKIRNDIIAHSARPQIPQSKYERTRDELIQILYRLTQKIYPCKSKDEIMNEIQEKVDSYQVCVDSPLTKYCIGRVQEWHLNFTNKVEESLKTLNEFDLYLTNKSNRYERYMKLLLKGGKNVLFGTLKRECRRKKYNIEDMSEFIKSSDHTEIESERKNWNSNPSNWDVWQLSTLLLDKFDKDLSANEVEEIVKIQKAVTNYSEAIVASLDSDRFNPLWTNLVSSIKCMSMVLDADIKQQCNDLIDDCYTENEVDLTFLKQYFPKIRTLTDEYKVQVRQIKDLLQEMKEHEISFPEPQKLEFKFITLGDNKEKTEIAEEILFTVWQEALERVKDSTKFKSVRIEVDKILQTIRNMPDLIDVTAVHKCIIVGICFDSPTGILELLSYLEDETFQQSITIIEIELEVVFDCCIKIMSNFTLESLHDITTNKAKGDKGKANVIRLPITCKSAEGIMAAWSFCQSKEMEESNMTISKSFSDNLGQSITLQTCLAGFYKHYDDTESESRSAEETIGEEMGIIECTTQTASEKLNGFLKPDPRQMGKYSSKMTGEQMDTMECTTQTVSETINGCRVRDQGQIIKYADMMKGEQMDTMECTTQTVSETINGCGEHDQGQIMKYADMMKGEQMDTMECTTHTVSETINGFGEHDQGQIIKYADMMKETLSTDSICGYYTSSSKEQSEDWTGKNKQSPEMFEKETYIDPIRLTPSSESTNNEDRIMQEQKSSDDDATPIKAQISIGDCVRPYNSNLYGTVGPFVRIKETGEMCFVTVRHIFGGLQQSNHMFIGSKVVHIQNNNNYKEIERVCGKVVACEYSEDYDAVLVKLSPNYIPNRYSFAAVNEEMFQKEGFGGAPKYASIHSVIDVRNECLNEMSDKLLIKIGNQTGWTKGTLLITDGIIKKEQAVVLYEYPNQWIIQAVPYYNYLHVKGSNGVAFAREEDSGSSIYLLDKNGQLDCLGILCRKMTNKDEYLIKQLDDILTCLGKQIGETLEMDKFTKMANEVDPYDKELYDHTLKDGFENDSQMRINIIGFFAQGKSTLTRRLLGQSLDNITCTDGIEVYVQKFKMQGSAWTTCDTMDIYEECSRRMVDITNREHVFPLESIGDDSVDETINEPEDGEKQTFTHGTNKTQTSAHTYSNTGPVHKLVDKKFSQIAKDQEKELQRRFLNHLRDDKDCNDQDVLLANIWDFGGQFIYYATHQIFHSKDAIYLLVFDLTKDLDAIIIDCDFPDRQEKMRNSLLFWVNSIQAYVGCDTSRENVKPTIILVGTHKDKLQGDVSLKFQEVFDLFAGTKFRIHIHEKPFAVASLDKDDKGIQNLKRTIYELGLKNARHAKIPANWILLELAMLRVRDEKMKQILEMKDIIALDTLNTHPILDQNEIKKFLNYHHAKGTFVFFDEEGLDKYIVLNPQFIVDAFRCIISAKWFCRWSQTVQINATKLKREAILERDLLDTVWSENRFTAFKDILLLFLEKHRILAELRRMDENTGNIQLLGKYMIPSLLNPELDLHETNDFLQNKEYTSIVLGLELEGLISTTVFEKCTAALLGKWPPIEYNDQVLVSQHEGLYRLDLQHAGLIQKSGENIELMVINLCPPEHPKSTTCDRFRRYVEMVLTFEKCKSHLRQQDVKPYRHYIKCNDSQHAGRGSHNIHYLNMIRNQPKVCCPDNRSHPIYVQEAIAEWFLEEGITDFETSIIRKTSKKDKLVSRVAREFGINWKMFGIAIGLSFEDLKLISDKCDQVKETNILIISMFDVWRKKYPDDSDYMHGRENQIEGNTDVIVDWDKVRNCFDSN